MKSIADFNKKNEQPGMWIAMDPEVKPNAILNLPPAQEKKPPPYSRPSAFGPLSTETEYQSEPTAEANLHNKRQTSEVEATANPKSIIKAKFAKKGGNLSSAQEDKLPPYSDMSNSETTMTQAVHAPSQPPAQANFHRESQVSKAKKAADPKLSFWTQISRICSRLIRPKLSSNQRRITWIFVTSTPFPQKPVAVWLK